MSDLSCWNSIRFWIYEGRNYLVPCVVRFPHSTELRRKDNAQPLHLQPEPRHQRVGRGPGHGGEFLWRTSRRNPVTLSNHSQVRSGHLMYRPIVVQRRNILLKEILLIELNIFLCINKMSVLWGCEVFIFFICYYTGIPIVMMVI